MMWVLANGMTVQQRGKVWTITEPGFCYYVGDANGCLLFIQKKGWTT